MKAPKIGNKTLLRENPSTGEPIDRFMKASFESGVTANPLYTGRHFLILNEGNRSIVKATKLLEGKLGFTVANTADFLRESLNESKIKDANALFYNELGIALVDIDEDQRVLLEGFHQDYLIAPEKVVYIPDDMPTATDISTAWGIEVTEALHSRYTGAGIKVAVIDTGFDTGHPDFAGREITTTTFVPDENSKDEHGHGTHCTGIACGAVDMDGVRYGVAPGTHIYAGKVLSNEGSGAQAWVLDGMTWAANNGCRVLSMSFGSVVFAGQSYDIAYERAAKYARSKGTVIVAAAGNESKRSKEIYYPVNSPADCPSILAVAALDRTLEVADFSNRAINAKGLVDVAAPGVSVYSSWIMPVRNRSVSGTSMATPHVAGIFALLFEKYPDATPAMAEKVFREMARKLPLSSQDVGAGLSIAP